MGEYINKKVGEISDLVKRKFKEVKKGNDYEKIYTAGQLAINEIVKQIKDDKSKVRGEWALAPLLGSQKTKERGLINEFKDSYKNVGFWENMFGENAKKISLVANKIDNAENETLKRLAKNRTVQDSRQLVKKSGEQHKNKPMFVMEGGNDYRKQTGNIIFTEAANPVRIDQALKGLFTNPNVVYEIDYSGCDTSTPKGKAIKEKMTKLIGTKTCYLGYDSNLKTYVIRDPAEEGKIISQRAYIWEGVKLIPAGIRQWQSYVEEKKGKGKLGEETVYNAGKLGKLTSEMLKDIPSLNEAIKKGELTTRQAVQLCQKTEIRLNNLLKKARELGYELEPECVTKKWVGNGHMELHLNNGSSSVSWTVWGNDGGYNKDLGKDLDEFIDDNEEEYKTYLTKRVQSKWLEFDSIAKTEITDVSKKGGKIGQGKLSEEERKAEKEKAEQHKNQVLIGIGILEQTVNNYDKGGNLLAEMKKLIRNAKVSIGGADVLDDNLITKNFIEPIREKWVIFKNLRDEYGNPVKGYANQHKYFKDIFLGNRDEQVIAMRELGRHGRVLDNTETSHLAEIIAGREDIGIKDAKVGECLDKIKNWTAMSIYDANGNINQKVKGWYDNTYASAKKGTDSLITLFVGRGWLPKNWKDEEKEVRKCMDNLKDKLNSINDQCNNISLSIDDMIKTQHEKRLKLEQKDNKTEEDMKVLQGLVYLEENPNKAKEIYKDVIEKSNMQLKYGDLGQVVKAGLLPALGELGGGITSNNDKIADIYNDIKGYGFWNLSDENAKLAGEILTEIVITVAVAVVTGGIGGVAMAAILRGGSIALRAAKWTSLANKVLKVVQISQKGYKGLSIGAKVVKSGYRGASLLIEGTTFNAASTMIHSAMNGTSLDALNLNPVAKENIQTAAFLGALSVSGKLTQGLMKLGGKTKLTVNLSKGLEKAHLTAPAKFTTGLVAEMGSMLAAEQAVNFTFGHDVIDPETGEVVTSRAPTLPTQQEMIQMIGMILAFKAVKPGIWAKYEQKLNNGTLEICRGTGKNQVLIRDPQTGKVENVQDLIDGKESTKGNQGKSDGKAKGQIEKGKKSTSSEKVQKAEEELKGIRDKITGVEARIKRIDGQIKNFEASREISNRERLAKDISKRRTYSENGNRPSDNIPINDHYEGRIIDGKIEIIDKRTGKINTVEFDAKKRINDLLGNDKELEKLDIEIAERMILGIKNGHVEVEDIAEARKIKNGYPDKDLEIVGLENGKVGVRKKTNILKLRQQKAELDAQLNGLQSEHRKKRTALNKEIKKTEEQETRKTEEQETKKSEEQETRKSEEQETKKSEEQETRKTEEQETRKSEEQETRKTEDIEKELDESLSDANKGNYENIKLDWVTKAQFEAGVYIEGIHRRFKKLSLKPNTKLPKEFLRRMGESLKELKAKCRDKLSEKYKKFVDKYNQYIERKLAGEGNEVEIKEEEIRSIEEIDKSKIDELSQFQEGETIELWVKLDENSSFREIWRKEKNGYREMEQKLNGKIKKTRKVITTEEMALKMKDVEKIESLTKRNEINGTDSPEVIAEKLEESLDNSTDFEVSQEAFVSGKFIEGIKSRFNKIIQRPNVSLPRESVKRLSGKIKEMMDKWGNKLSDNYRNLTERFSRYLNDLLKQTGEKIKIKEQQRMERKEQQRMERKEQQRRQREEQERKQREEQEKRQRETKEGKENIYSKTMSQQEKIEFNNAAKTEKAKFYINEGFNPKNVIHLPNGEKLYVTDKIVKGGSRPQIVGYAIENGRMNIRLFYRSSSEGCRRSSGGSRQSDGAYSKGEFIKDSSYETTTKVDYKIGELFDKLPESENFSKRWNNIEYDLWEKSGETREEILKKEMQENIKVESVMFPDLPKGGAVYFYAKRPPQEVINGYNKLVPEGLNYTEMRVIPEKGYSYNHNYLGAVNVEAVQMKYRGRDIYVYFSRAKNSPNKVWIENIVYADAKINTFGVYDKQINAGPLIAKPIDYAKQVPTGWTGNGEYYGGFMGFRMDGYLDIRDLYQGNPIIKEYKKLSGEKSYENDRMAPSRQQRKESQGVKIETKNEYVQQYQLGQEVYVKRSAGGESKARVESYDPKTGEYIVRWNEGGRWLQKKVTSESLREIKNGEKNPAQYEAIKEIDHKSYIKMSEDTETEVPLLSDEDISLGVCTANDGGNYIELKSEPKSKVINHDPRSLLYSQTKQDRFEGNSQKQMVLYDKKNDITHIVSSGGLSSKPTLSLTIKGKVSLRDATALIKYLENNKLLVFNLQYGNVISIGGQNGTTEFNKTSIENFKKGVAKFFNEK